MKIIVEEEEIRKIIRSSISEAGFDVAGSRIGGSGTNYARDTRRDPEEEDSGVPYDGDLVTVVGNKKYLGKPGEGLSPGGFWESFRSRFGRYINSVYPELGLRVGNLGVSRDLAAAADAGGNTARVSGSKHGAGMAQDLYLHTQKYGDYTNFRKDNKKLAKDQKLIDSIVDFMKLPEQKDLLWGGAFGSGKTLLNKGEKPARKGILEFHHFEFRGGVIPKFFRPHEDELDKLDMSSSQLTGTVALGKLYNKLV